MTEPNIAFVANLMADPSRAAMCLALAGGQARPAGALAARAGHRGERPARAGAGAAVSRLDRAPAPRGRPGGHRAGGARAAPRLGAAAARHARRARDAVGTNAAPTHLQRPLPGGSAMITLCIRYTLEARKRSDFERYARGLTKSVPRCGGELVGYWLPTKFAGPTNVALALINFPDLAAYEQYRER